MIAHLIDWSLGNRALTLLLAACLAAVGAWSAATIDIDAIPDLSDVQVIVRTEYPGQAPTIVQDQVTYPLTTAMLATPGAEVVRGVSMFGTSFVSIIFKDGTDLYWARSRVLEQLNTVASRLPAGVTPRLGPDATGVGWVFQYMLLTGAYCANHPNGLWQDPVRDSWFEDPRDAPEDARSRLVHHRIFDTPLAGSPLPGDSGEPGSQTGATCPLDGEPLVQPDLSLADLRDLQDWRLRDELTAVSGVSQVAAVGGFLRQYQVVIDPVRLLAYNLPLSLVKNAIERSNIDVGGRILEQGETEFLVRGLGYLGSLTDDELAAARDRGESIPRLRTDRTLRDLESIALDSDADGRPIFLRDVARVQVGPDQRRGIAEWSGRGEAVGAIVLMRVGENARTVIARVKNRLAELERTLPPGVAARVGYDRSDLINRAVGTLRHTLTEEILVVSLVVAIFLLHLRSSLVAVIVLPIGVLAAIGAMRLLGVDANIMSLGGIAISIGVMVDSSIIMVENAHKHIENDTQLVALGAKPTPRLTLLADASKEVGPSLFFALLIITASFLPVFALGGESGRLFKPLAFTKTFSMLAGAGLAVTLIPVLMTFLLRERMLPERMNRPGRIAVSLFIMVAPAVVVMIAPLDRLDAWRHWLALGWVALAGILILPQRFHRDEHNPLSRAFRSLYEPVFAVVMRFRWITLALAAMMVVATLWPLKQLGSEFMPPLEEGDLLYMPTVDPGVSASKAREILQRTNKLIMTFPEVESAFGKIGRADTATDPAPLTMGETTIMLKRDKSQWRTVPVTRFFDEWPDPIKKPLRALFPAARPITLDELIYGATLPAGAHIAGLNEVVRMPGVTNAWTMPIRTRIDMLSTGIRTPVGIKVIGDDLSLLSDLAGAIAATLQTDDSTAAYTTSAFAEKTVAGDYLDIDINRDEIARFNLRVGDVQNVIASAIGGVNITETVEGLDRHSVNLRYPAELRDSIDSLANILVATPLGAQVPLGQLATFTIRQGPPMIKSENARPTSWVFVDIAGIDVGTYIARARRLIEEQVPLPQGVSLIWSGQYEAMQAARARLRLITPIAGVVIILLLYLATKSWLRVGLVLLALPFSMVGAIWLLYLLDYNISLAVVVGLIALAGLDAETGLVMLLYLDTSYKRFEREGRMRNTDDLWWAIHDGAVQRIRPKTMTVAAVFTGLLPLLWATGAGADTMRRLAIPIIGGVSTSFLLELLIYPILFYSAKRITLHADTRAARERTMPGSAALPGAS